MSKLADVLASPKIGLFLFGPFILLALMKGCGETDSEPRRRRG